MKKVFLNTLFEKQSELMKFYTENREWYKYASLEEKLFTFAYAIINECNEFIDGLNWKPWKNKKEIDREYLKEELIDILHFWITLCLYLKITPSEVYEAYIKKNKENFDRQKYNPDYKIIDENDGYSD